MSGTAGQGTAPLEYKSKYHGEPVLAQAKMLLEDAQEQVLDTAEQYRDLANEYLSP